MSINRDKVRAAAQKFLQKGQLDKAIKEFERLVEDDPNDVRTLLKLGDLQTRAGENAAATQTYMRVAQFYGEQGFFLKAVAVYKQILKIDSSILEVNVKLAELYQQLGLLSDANTQYRQLAQLFEQQNRIEDCIGVLRKMIESDPENVASRVKLAELYAKQNMVEDAKREFRESAAFLKRQRRLDDWLKVAERMVFFCPDDLATTRELADAYVQKGDARRALAKLQVCFKQNPRDTETLELLANAFNELGQVQKAVSVLKELARIQRQEGDEGRFRAAMQRVVELAPTDPEARQALAGHGAPANVGPAPAQAVHAAAAPAVAQPAVAPPPRRPPQREAPRVELETHPAAPSPPPSPHPAAPTGTASKPEDSVSRLLVEADIYVKYGLRAKALDQVRKVLAMAPDSREAQEKHKALLLEGGDTAGAVLQIFEMAQAALARGDLARARDDLEELLGIDPADNRAHELLLQLHQREAGSEPDLDVEALVPEIDTSEEVPSVVREGAPAMSALSYEPSPEAAEIDLDAETDDLAISVERPAALSAAGSQSAAGSHAASESPALAARPQDPVRSTAREAVVLPTPPAQPLRAPARSAPTSRPDARPAEIARPDGLHVAARSSPAVPKSPPARPSVGGGNKGSATGIADIDALLASAVPARGRGVAEPVKPAAAESTTLEDAGPGGDTASPSVSVPTVASAPSRTAPPSPPAASAPSPLLPPSAPAAAAARTAEPKRQPAAEPAPSIDVEIEEARFYLTQGLTTEARDALNQLERAHPHDPRLEALAAEIGGTTVPAAGSAPGSGASDDELAQPAMGRRTSECSTAGPSSPPPGDHAGTTRLDSEGADATASVPPPPDRSGPNERPSLAAEGPEPSELSEPAGASAAQATDAAALVAEAGADDSRISPERGSAQGASAGGAPASPPTSISAIAAPTPSTPSGGRATVDAPAASATRADEVIESGGGHREVEERSAADAEEPVASAALTPAAPVPPPGAGEPSEPSPPATAPTSAQTVVQPDGTSDEDLADARFERIDIAEELATELAAAPDADLRVSFNDVFDEFKRGVAEQVADSDHQTHYDLGIAYKEMGLLEDAIREFTIAQRTPLREVVALTMIGLCCLERGDSAAALRQFQLGLRSERATANEVAALRYEIGRAFEAMGRPGDALKFYERVHADDPEYRDIVERLREVREQGGNVAESGHELDALLENNPSPPDPGGPKISYL